MALSKAQERFIKQQRDDGWGLKATVTPPAAEDGVAVEGEGVVRLVFVKGADERRFDVTRAGRAVSVHIRPTFGPHENPELKE